MEAKFGLHQLEISVTNKDGVIYLRTVHISFLIQISLERHAGHILIYFKSPHI